MSSFIPSQNIPFESDRPSSSSSPPDLEETLLPEAELDTYVYRSATSTGPSPKIVFDSAHPPMEELETFQAFGESSFNNETREALLGLRKFDPLLVEENRSIGSIGSIVESEKAAQLRELKAKGDVKRGRNGSHLVLIGVSVVLLCLLIGGVVYSVYRRFRASTTLPTPVPDAEKGEKKGLVTEHTNYVPIQKKN